MIKIKLKLKVFKLMIRIRKEKNFLWIAAENKKVNSTNKT